MKSFFEFLEQIRTEPLEVRRQAAVFLTIVVVMIITVVWAIGFMVGLSDRFDDGAAEAEPSAAPQSEITQ